MQVPEIIAPLAAGSKFDRDELTVDVARENLLAALRALKGGGWERLGDVTAVDRHPSEPRFEIIYHLASVSMKQRLRLKVRLSGDAAEVESATQVYRSANWYEREVFDLFGVKFLNHPDMRRIMMPDEWEGHPLRKDYPVEGYK